MIADTKVSRVVQAPIVPGGWLARAKATGQLLHDDLPMPLLVVGLAGLLLHFLRGHRREGLGLLLAGLPYWVLAMLVWEGQVSDALLAAKMPVSYVAGLGLGLAAAEAARRWPRLRTGVQACLAAVCAILFVSHRPTVLNITRDAGAEEVIATVERVIHMAEPGRAEPDRPTTFMALWGHDYWALTYAQAYREQLWGLTLVDHKADFRGTLERGERLLTLERTFYHRPLSWWEECAGAAHLSSAALGVVEIAQAPHLALADVPAGPQLDLGNGIRVASAGLEWDLDELRLTVYWQAEGSIDKDYSVGVHLLAHDPPRGPNDILEQADSRHPVYGWYPTSRWKASEIVRDDYAVQIPPGAQAVAVRVGMYLVDPQGQFVNTEWLSLPVPDG